MPLTLALCDASDVPLLTAIYMTSFKDALSHRCFPRSPAVDEWWTNMNVDDCRHQPSARFLKITDTETQKIVAYGKWNVPAKVGDELLGGGDDPDEMPVWPEGGDKELSEEFFGELASARRRIMGDKPHCFLEIVVTLPKYQGRGCAGQIMRWGLEKADQEGMEAYLEAGPGLVGLYERYGWRVRERFTPSRLGDHEECFMVREAKS